MALTFKYKKVKRGDSEIKSPPITVSFWGSGPRYEFIALIDSGADISVIPKDVADLLGLDLTGKVEETRGIGGKVPAVQTKINVELGRPHEKYSFELPVKVILEDGDEEIPILFGRSSFFDKFIITFNQKEERIILKKN